MTLFYDNLQKQLDSVTEKIDSGVKRITVFMTDGAYKDTIPFSLS